MRSHRRKRAALGSPDGEELLGIVGAIYEAALDQSRWAAAMARITRAIGGHRALMFVPDLNAGGFWAAHDIEPEMMSGYHEHYRSVDIWTNRCNPFFAANGSTALSECVVPEREFLRSEFWNDFTRRADIFRLAGVAVDIKNHAPETGTLLCVYRPRNSHPFDASARIFLRRIQPHLLRSLTIGKLLADVSARTSRLQAMLDSVAKPMFACTASACIVHANAAAEVLLRAGDGLSSEGSCLAAITAALTTLLRRAIAHAANATASNPASVGSTLKLPQRFGAGDLIVTVSPLPQDAQIADIERATVLVSVQRERRPVDLAATKLREIYRLTEGELNLVSAMLDGGALPAVAGRLGIGHNTARTHLKHVFEKTQTRRQAELLQLVHVLAR